MSRVLSLGSLLVVVASFCSCASTQKSRTGTPAAASKFSRSKTMDSDSDNAFGLQSIHFPAVSLVIEPPERDKLVKNVAILKARPKIYVELEGHTDGRGKMDQSFQLAEARAAVVKRVLIGLGI